MIAEKQKAEYDFILLNGLKTENAQLKEAINEVLEVLDGKGSPNMEWIKVRLINAIKEDKQ